MHHFKGKLLPHKQSPAAKEFNSWYIYQLQSLVRCWSALKKRINLQNPASVAVKYIRWYTVIFTGTEQGGLIDDLVLMREILTSLQSVGVLSLSLHCNLSASIPWVWRHHEIKFTKLFCRMLGLSWI